MEDIHESYVDQQRVLEPAYEVKFRVSRVSAAAIESFQQHNSTTNSCSAAHHAEYFTFIAHRDPAESASRRRSAAAIAAAMGTRTYEDSSEFVKHPMLGGIKPLQMLLWTANHVE